MVKQSSISLIIPSLVYGGAERVIVGMANWWAARDRIVKLITFDGKPSPFALHESITRIALNNIDSTEMFYPEWPEESHNLSKLRQALQIADTDNYISFLSRMNMRTILSSKGLKRNIIVSERTYPPAVPLHNNEEKLRRYLYPEANYVVMLHWDFYHNWAAVFLNIEKVRIIENPIWPFNSDNNPTVEINNEYHGAPYLLAVGRLAAQKGFDLLLSAFALIHNDWPELKLVIAGEGVERDNLRQQISTLNLQSKVFLPGNVEDIENLMRGALCFVLSSRFEGMPNALLEAMSLGVPCVSFDCPTGPRELIKHEINGLLVEEQNVRSLGVALQRMICDIKLRNKLAQNARKSMARFLQKNIMPLWEELLV